VVDIPVSANRLRITVYNVLVVGRRVKGVGETRGRESCPSSVAERLRRRLCNQKIAGSNLASGHLATPFRKEI